MIMFSDLFLKTCQIRCLIVVHLMLNKAKYLCVAIVVVGVLDDKVTLLLAVIVF